MTDLDALLQAVIADPDDDLVRYLFADALDDRGQPGDEEQADRIRISLAMPNACYPTLCVEGTFHWRRGWPEKVTCNPGQWKRHGRYLVSQMPITYVQLTELGPDRIHIKNGVNYRWNTTRIRRLMRSSTIPSWLASYINPHKLHTRHQTIEDALVVVSDACLAYGHSPAPVR